MDFLAKSGKDSAEAGMTLAATIELLDETGGAVEQVKTLKELKEQVDQLNDKLNTAQNLDSNVKKLVRGIDFDSTARISENIQKATQYIRLIKSTMKLAGLLSPQVQISLNTASSASTLNRIEVAINEQNIQKEKEKNEEKKVLLQNFLDIKAILDKKNKAFFEDAYND